MRIKITHPDDLAARNELIIMLLFSLLTIIVWSCFTIDGSTMDDILADRDASSCLLALLAVIGYFLFHSFYLLLVKRAERRKNGPDVKTLEFAAQGVSVYRPPLAPLFFPYKETSFSLEVIAVRRDRFRLPPYNTVSAVYMTFVQQGTKIYIPCGILRKGKQLRPLLDARHRFASFSLSVVPFGEQDSRPSASGETETPDNIPPIPKERQEPEEVSAIRQELEDYMKYGAWPALSGAMRRVLILYGLMPLAGGICMAFLLYEDKQLLWIPFYFLVLAAFLLYIGIKDWLAVRKLKRLKSRDLENRQRAAAPDTAQK